MGSNPTLSANSANFYEGRPDPADTLPVLILHGTGDKVTRPAGSQLFYDARKLYEGHFHDFLNDLYEELQERIAIPRSFPLGWMSFGLSRSLRRDIFSTWPDAGFHRRLAQLSLRRLRTHPWTPLPMVRL